MTILRVGTNEKYADGWASVFGGGKTKKKAAPAVSKTKSKKAAEPKAAKKTTVKAAKPKAAAKPLTKTTAKKASTPVKAEKDGCQTSRQAGQEIQKES